MNEFGFIPDDQALELGFTPDNEGAEFGFTPSPSTPAQRGFLSKMGENYERGNWQFNTGISLYQALKQGKDINPVLQAHWNVENRNKIDPIDGNWLADLAYGGANVVGQLLSTTEKAVPVAVAGAGAGATLGATVGGLMPSIGEEPFTVAGGAIGGASAGLKAGYMIYSYQSIMGNMFADLVKDGSNPELAQQIASWAAIPSMVVEFYQGKQATPALRKLLTQTAEKSTAKLFKKYLTKYGKTLGKEVLEEMTQEGIQIVAEDSARVLRKEGITVDEQFLRDRAVRIWETGVQSAKMFALIPAPGVAVEAGVEATVGNIQAEEDAMAAQTEVDRASAELRPEDVEEPHMKFYAAINQSIKEFEVQEEERTSQRAEKAKGLGVAHEEATFTAEEARIRGNAALKGALANRSIKPLDQVLPPETYNDLLQEARTTTNLDKFATQNLMNALHDMFTEGKIFRPFEIEYARKVWGGNIANVLQELSTRANPETFMNQLIEAMNLPRSSMAAGDLSRTFRQHILLTGSPKTLIKSIRQDWKLLLSNPKVAEQMDMGMLTSQFGQWAVSKAGIRWNKIGGGVETGTERFLSMKTGSKVRKFLTNIPGYGKLTTRSESAYTIGGNATRLEVLKGLLGGREFKTLTKKQAKDLGRIADILTGEGNASILGKMGPVLYTMLFSTRLLASRIQAFTELIPGLSNMDAPARKVLAWQLVKAWGVQAAIISSAAMLPGVEVERDPRSTDFGKMRIGDTRIDLMGGFQQIFRTIAQLITKQRKGRTGDMIDAEMMDTAIGFLQSKLAPAPSYAIDLIRGETFYGEEVELTKEQVIQQIYENAAFLWLQDVVDALRYQGFLGGVGVAPLTFLGVGASTYPLQPGTKLALQRNELSMEVFGKKWNELGPAVQKYAKENFPELAEWEREADMQQNSPRLAMRRVERLAKIRKDMHDQLPADVSIELDKLAVDNYGVDEFVADGWKLNPKRFKEYKNTTVDVLTDIVRKMVGDTMWNTLTPDIKKSMLEGLVVKVKQSVRQKIVNEANVKDLEGISRNESLGEPND